MLGSHTPRPVRPRPLDFAVRLLVASAIVLSALHLYQRTIIEPFVPAFGDAARLLAADFVIVSADVAQEGPNETVRIRANLAIPLQYANRIIPPFGWNRSVPQGWYQVDLSLGGLLQNSAFLLITVLAWPASPRDLALRIALCVPAVAFLLFLEAPVTIVAELWNTLRNTYDPHGSCGWMVWSRYLMGGGGSLFACVLGAMVIGVVRRLRAERPQSAALQDRGHTSGYARLVLKPRASNRECIRSAEE